jgi:uncharacterized protein (TIGR02246 family)
VLGLHKTQKNGINKTIIYKPLTSKSKEKKMKKSNWLLSKIILVITLAMLCFTLSCQKQDVEADIAAIEDVLNQYTQSMMDGDLDLWMSLYTDDTIKMLSDQPAILGKEKLRASMKPLFDNFKIEEFTLNDLEIQVAGSWAFSFCNFTVTMTPKAGGEQIYMDAKDLAIYERQVDGSWKVARDCWNSNTPPKVE